ncbi:MAG: NUDIX hydrolase [Chlamydiales bacterium]|nr:NUDIX hydrolase [Chlamydiales bacterium]
MTEECFHLGAKVFLCNQENEILLLEKQHRIRGIYWDLPGGRLQKGETILETLRREVEEETGFAGLVDVVPFDMILSNIRISTNIGEVGLILSMYRCHIGSSFTPRLSQEHTSFGWFKFSEATELLKNQYPISLVEKILLSEKTINIL